MLLYKYSIIEEEKMQVSFLFPNVTPGAFNIPQ